MAYFDCPNLNWKQHIQVFAVARSGRGSLACWLGGKGLGCPVLWDVVSELSVVPSGSRKSRNSAALGLW